jgi:hypothetical protein
VAPLLVHSLESPGGSGSTKSSSELSRQYASSKQDQELLLDFIKGLNKPGGEAGDEERGSSQEADQPMDVPIVEPATPSVAAEEPAEVPAEGPESAPSPTPAGPQDVSAPDAPLPAPPSRTQSPAAMSITAKPPVADALSQAAGSKVLTASGPPLAPGAPAPTSTAFPPHGVEEVRLHSAALLFPSARRRSSGPPPTFRMTIREGQLAAPPASACTSTSSLHTGNEPVEPPPSGSSSSLSWDSASQAWEQQQKEQAQAQQPPKEGTPEMEQPLVKDVQPFAGQGPYQPYNPPTQVFYAQHQHAPPNVAQQPPGYPPQSCYPSANASRSTLPIMPVKRYPFPEIRTLHSAVFRAPHIVPDPPAVREHELDPAGGEQGQGPYDQHLQQQQQQQQQASPSKAPSLNFNMPGKEDLRAMGLSPVPNASEVRWEQRAAGQVRRPPNIVPPPVPPNAMGPTRRSMAVSDSATGISTRRRPARNTSFWTSSTDSLACPSGASASSAQSEEGGDPWMPFRSLVSVADKGSKRLERQNNRSYNCPWFRVGYYRKLDDKYGDVRLYDSEDSEYEEPEESGWEYYQGLAPPPREFRFVRSRMLEIDAQVGTGQAPPKYFLPDWKKNRRRAAERARRMRERYDSGTSTPPRQRRASDAGRYSGSRGGSASNSPLKSGSSAAMRRNNEHRIQHALQQVTYVRGTGPQPIPHQNLTAEQQQALAAVVKKSPLKRQSTSLKLSYEYMPNGQIKCLRCGKKGFHNEFALRSHLSHCPGTIKIREQRLQMAAGILPADTPIQIPLVLDDGEVVVEGGGYDSSGAPSPVLRATGAGSVASSPGPPTAMLVVDRKLPPSSLSREVSLEAEGLFLPPPSLMPTYDGNPLVPETIADGETLIGREIGFKNRGLDSWTKVVIRNYRTRRNTHLVQYADATTEWVVLTDWNCNLDGVAAPPAHLSSPPQLPPSMSLGLAPSSSSGNLAGLGLQGVDSAETDSLSSRAGDKRSRADSSAEGEDEGDDGDPNRAPKRRSTRLTDVVPPPLTTVSSGDSSYLNRNAFFTRQEELLTRRRERRRNGEDKSETGDEVRGARGGVDCGCLDSCQALRDVSLCVELDGVHTCVCAPQMQPSHQYEEEYEQHPSPELSPARSHKSMPTMSRYTGSAYSPMPMHSAAAMRPMPAHYQTIFACRRCHKTFGNKQVRGRACDSVSCMRHASCPSPLCSASFEPNSHEGKL